MAVWVSRVIVPVTSIEKGTRFYRDVLGMPGERVSKGCHYFNCDPVILACLSPREDGDGGDLPANPDHIYFCVDNLEYYFDRCKEAECRRLDDRIAYRSRGEQSFYAEDPFGNKLCFVQHETFFSGRRPDRQRWIESEYMVG